MALTLTRQTDYALQLVHALSQLPDGAFLALPQFAKRSKLSLLFLQRIVREMVAARLVRAVRGRSGGYRLNRPAYKITVHDVVSVLEGETAIVPCVRFGKNICPHASICATRTNFHTINAHIQKYLASITIADL